MTKKFDLDIDEYQASIYLSAIRSKRDIIVIWMETIKNFLVGEPAENQYINARLTIYIGKMSRLFCTSEEGKKIFSVGFPFSVSYANGQYKFFSREGVEIDNKVSSNVIELIDSGEIFGAQDFCKFIDPIMEMSEYDPQLWTLMRELMIAEDGYIRYDWDAVREDGHRHPLHHLDVYYSSASTFKIGLGNQIDQPSLMSILDLETDCHYLKSATG
ncbi:hypothetical protein LH435_03185 [Laribacter hongkongensis]|uniref:hypothetical protein n=1 Tax=Laribacter hongkongensis TaxID=168471 RepID=UPI001EFD0F0F|nr:hypothetical protein [Laribacter hongkongensis]MCG8994568.1 hypothetical protein [Laribacter hongkongensis]MCG9009221.1 hypothetical protein [Laribacter hongkongensis]MCG9021836.1 hypothetical protein [Laribacter hongkongensis]MCG9045565.1 hypothetical protein [Laribacter hongkongensis]MCG9073030.1 hypothetical protein [Laribacter hongkongensis]